MLFFPTYFVLFIIFFYWFWGILRKKNNEKQVPFGYKGIPGVGFLPHFKGLQCQRKLINMKKRYGKICKVRMGSFDCIWLNDYQLIKSAWNNTEFCARPDIPGISLRTKGFKAGIIFNDGEDFADQRKFVIHLLKMHGLGKTSCEEFVIKEVNHVIDIIEKKNNLALSTRHLFNIATFNILWSIITGGSSSRFSNDDPEMHELVKVLNRHMELNDGARAAVFMPWLSKYFPWFIGWKTYIRDAHFIYDFWKNIALQKMKSYEDGCLEQEDGLLKSYCEKISLCAEPTSSFYKTKGVTSLAIVLQDLFIAGSETTASTLQWAFLYLATFTECQENIAEEIFAVLGANNLPTTSDLKRMTYTEAFILETLRFSTLAPLGMLHCTSKDVMFHGFLIPKGTIMISNVCAVHYDEEYWTEPYSFKPERFLRTSSNSIRDLSSIKGFIPFSIGKRYCPGSKLAMQTLFLVLVSLVQRFKVSISYTNKCGAQLAPKIGISAVPYPHELVFKKRNH